MNEQTDLLREMRDLLRVIAEPALAKRDATLRTALRQIGGKADSAKARAILLMDGTRTQATICKEGQIDKGALSRLVTALRAGGLMALDEKYPRLPISIPGNFFETTENSHG